MGGLNYDNYKDYKVIESEVLKVYINDTFPGVMKYVWKADNSSFSGQEDIQKYVLINNISYSPLVSFDGMRDQAVYKLLFDDIQVEMRVEIKVVRNVLEFKISEILEKGDTKVYSIQLNHGLVSVSSKEDNASAAFVSVTGWNETKDEFISLSSSEIKDEEFDRTYAILYTNKLAVSVDCNSLDDYKRLRVKTEITGNSKKCSVSAGAWTYRVMETETVETPWAKVVINGDANGDGVIDWQDGCIGYQSIIPDPLGADMLRKSISHLAMNFASLTQHPFLRILDNIKKLHLYIDGFGQMLLLKGYQSEGHDSSNLDYAGHYNQRAGGLEELRILAQNALKYNCFTGVHINHTETHPEAHNHDNVVATDKPGWAWLDQSWLIDKYADVSSGNLYRRLEALKKDFPELSWIYVDVYDPKGTEWEAWKLSSKINDLGIAVGSEYGGVFEKRQIWAHAGHMESKLIRFIRNHQQDVWLFGSTSMLLGYDHTGFMGWDREKNIIDVVRIFFTKNLPIKYMQNFRIRQWSDDFISFDGELVVRKEGNVVNLYKDSKKIATDSFTKIFIPWDPVNEDKIYHWNSESGKTQWELPGSWTACSEVFLYQLSDLGRIFVGEIPVCMGIIDIDANANTPYVIYKVKQPKQEVQWGEGNIIKDPGFDSHGFSVWRKSSSFGDTSHVNIKNNNVGQSYLDVSGNNGADAVVSQKISGLVPGHTYQLSVWVEVTNRRRASLGVKDFGGEEVAKAVSVTNIPNYDTDNSKGGGTTNFQRIKLYFTPKEGYTTATIYLMADKGNPDSKAMFDDVRIKVMSPADKGNHYYFEDFENYDEGWGPFVRGYNYDMHVHRSEKHEGYTDDTIRGQFSLKIFSGPEYYELDNQEIIRTLPSELKLQPFTTYTVSFKCKADNKDQYKVVVRTNEGGFRNEVLRSDLDNESEFFSGTFTTKGFDDYYIAFIKNDREQGNLVIDDFAVDVGKGD